MADKRKSYPSDVNDDEWAFCVQHLTLVTEEAPQRDYPLRELFDSLRWFVRAGCPWQMMPHDLPPWTAVCSPEPLFFSAAQRRKDQVDTPRSPATARKVRPDFTRATAFSLNSAS